MCHSIVEHLCEIFLSVGCQCVLVLLQIHLEDILQLLGRVVGEVDVTVEARLQSRVGVDETVHLVLVASDNHNETVTVVLHALEDGGYCLLTVVVAIATLWGEGIGLVDEQHAIEGFHDDAVGLGTCLSDILATKSCSVGLDGMSLLQHTEILVDTSDDAGDGGLTRTR